MTAIEIVVGTRGNPVVAEARHAGLAGFDIRRDGAFSRTCPQRPPPCKGAEIASRNAKTPPGQRQ